MLTQSARRQPRRDRPPRVRAPAVDLGIGTVAVYSDADADAPHVREADAAVRLPGNAPAETYLRAELIVAAALAAGADAVHPGYGFLSENAAFARAVLDAGLTWIGPPPDAIDAMGSKIAAKKLMAAAGVPDPRTTWSRRAVHRGATSRCWSRRRPAAAGAACASSARLADLPGEIEAARSEAGSRRSATDRVLRAVPGGRRATSRCRSWPTPTAPSGRWASASARSSGATRRWSRRRRPRSSTTGCAARLCAAAVAAARAVGYVGAGTVEFLADERGRFFFLEMNTRLQVEHPVTECVTGLDLVRLQLRDRRGRAAAGATPPPLVAATRSRSASTPRTRPPAGCRRPARCTRSTCRAWTPRSGVPTGGGLRLDAGVESGSVVGVHYDPMLAKVIAYAPTRTAAARRLATALAGARIHGLVTNRDLLVRVLRHPAFLAGDTDTAFLDRHGLDTLAAPAGRRLGRAPARRWRPASPTPRRTGPRPGCWAGCPAAGATSCPPPHRREFEGDLDGLATGSRAPARSSPTTTTTSGCWPAARTRWCWRRPGSGGCSPSRTTARPWAPRARRLRARARHAAAGPALPRHRVPGGRGIADRADARLGRPGRRRGRRRRRGRATAAVAGGDEDGARDQRAGRRRVVELRVEPGSQVEVGAVLAIVEEPGGA